MSFIAKLELDGQQVNVIHCRYQISQEVDATARPTSIPHGGLIDVTVESNGSTDLFDWMISATQTKNGSITFFRRDTNSQLKTLKFSNAHCIDYIEEYTYEGEFPMRTTLKLSAKEIKLNESSLKKNWPV
ncbi:hypothetical protein GCM10027051_29870 [Niabella terrae]